MSCRRTVFVSTYALAAAVCTVGCTGLKSGPLGFFSRRELSPDSEVTFDNRSSETRRVASPQPQSLSEPVFGAPSATTTHDDAMAAVLEDLEEIRAIDPDAQQLLLEDLKTARPALWPLMVQQFRAALSYRQQLAEIDATNTSAVGRLVDSDDQPVSRFNGSENASSNSPESLFAEYRESEFQGNITGSIDEESTLENGIRRGPHVQGVRIDSVGTASFDVGTATRESPEIARQLPSQLPYGMALASYEGQPISRPVRYANQNGDGIENRRLPTTAADRRTPDSADSWQAHVKDAIALLSEESAQRPRTAEEVVDHARLRLLHLAIGQSSEGIGPIDGISRSARDYWSHQLFALSTLTDVNSQPDGKRRASAAAVHLEDALWQLRKLGVLTVRNLTFCQEVFDYGAYEIYPSNRFAPGKQVTLYAEVENYDSQLTEKGYYTSLASSYEVLSDDGESIASGDFPDVADHCRNRRRDFHIQYGLALPDRVPRGHYRLQLTIQDNQSHKLGQNVIEFDIVGGGAEQ